MKVISVSVLVILNGTFGLSDISLKIWPNDTILEYNVGDTINFSCQVENVSKVPQLYEIKDNYLRQLNVSVMTPERKINYTKKMELSDNESMIYCLCFRNSNKKVRFPPSVISDVLEIKIHMSKEESISINKGTKLKLTGGFEVKQLTTSIDDTSQLLRTRASQSERSCHSKGCKANAARPKINIKTKEISANETRVMCTDLMFNELNIRSDPVIHLYEIRGKELYVTTEQSITGTANFTVKTNVTGKVLTIFCGARPNNETYTEFIISELVKLRRSNVSINQQSTNKNQTISGTTNSPENNEQSNAENNEQSIIGVIAGASIGSLLLILVIILFICKIRSNGQIPDACTPKVYYKTVKYSGNGIPDAQIDGVSKPKENCTSEVHYAEICVSNSITTSLPPRDETTYAKIIGILKPKERKV